MTVPQTQHGSEFFAAMATETLAAILEKVVSLGLSDQVAIVVKINTPLVSNHNGANAVSWHGVYASVVSEGDGRGSRRRSRGGRQLENLPSLQCSWASERNCHRLNGVRFINRDHVYG
jgi:hypothetical protein